MTHIMLDTETLGTTPGSVILSVGACSFDPKNPDRPMNKFYRNIDADSSKALNMTTDPSTMAWWREQSAEAKAALLVDPQPLDKVLWDFSAWFEQEGGEEIWSHGSVFDQPIMEEAYRLVGMLAPWNFRNCRDTRTLYAVLDFDYSIVPREGTHHNALDDAVYQALCVTAAYSHLHQITEGR